jgi:hypothetical protein
MLELMDGLKEVPFIKCLIQRERPAFAFRNLHTSREPQYNFLGSGKYCLEQGLANYSPKPIHHLFL